MGKMKIVPKNKIPDNTSKGFVNSNVIALPKSEHEKSKELAFWLITFMVIEHLGILSYLWLR